MPTIEVNLDAGLNTQDDPKRVGLNGFTALNNMRHANGKLMKRYGTGVRSAALSNCEITNAGVFVHRKLTGYRVNDLDASSGNRVRFTDNTTMLVTGTINTTNITIPGGSTDLRDIFKPGDTVVISTDGTSANKDKALVINTVPDATTMTFTTFITNEVLGTSGDELIISFIFDRDDDESTPNNLIITDTNSIDGRAFITTFIDGAEMKIGMFNANDYGDLDTIAENDANSSFNGTSDMHIRMGIYTDGVRFACGLEHAPVIFKYINRHHFNGLLKSVYNANAHTLYPTFFTDTAIPVVASGTYALTTFKADDIGGTNDSIRYINGSLNLKDNTYNYKFVPVYDGVQEELLANSITSPSTGSIAVLIDKNNQRSVLSTSSACILATITIDMTTLNARTSGINVYRSTNGGTYYKIKSIYMGDNDQNQHALSRIYMETDRLWFTGSTGTLAADTLDAFEVMIDGANFAITDGSGENDFNGVGYKSVDLGSAIDAHCGIGSYSRSEYGDMNVNKFNSISEPTEIILGGDDTYAGGSPNGGWYIANATDRGATALANRTDVTGYVGMTSDNDNYEAGNPFGDSASQNGFDFWAGNDGDGANDAGFRFDFSDTGTIVPAGTYIISGWIKAEGLDHPESSWNLYIDTSTATVNPLGPGIQQIAKGKGIYNANMPWSYFQYEIELGSDAHLYGYLFVNTPDAMTSAAGSAGINRAVRVWGISIRAVVSGYTLGDGLRGFMGMNILASSKISDLALSPGVLKGNRIQEDSSNDGLFIPVDVDADRTYISDNFGPFIKTVDKLPGNIPTDNTYDSWMFGSSNYQFYFSGAVNTVANMKLDFFDPGLPDGARHPNETATSTDVKFKYATMLNGRQFVANVKITGDDGTEEYPNFVMFSEANSPDIIPTSNFIQLQDLQGGEIVGIESLMSDIVVFMTNGIFRINVPSSNPTAWSLVESHPNIGCLHDKGIEKVPNGIYFLSKDDVIFLDSGFKATPITYPIRDDYQAITASTPSIMRVHYNVKSNRLYVTKAVSSGTTFWLYDVIRQTWSTETHTSSEYDEFSLDNNNNTILIESAASSYVRKAVNTASTQDNNGSGGVFSTSFTTGTQELTSYDKNAHIRRINVGTTIQSGGTEFSIISSGAQPVFGASVLPGTLTSTVSLRTSQRGNNIKLNFTDITDENKTKEISRVEVEYE